MIGFLDFIQDPIGYCEIRSIRDGVVRQQWYTDRSEAIAHALEDSAAGYDAYYGVVSRLTPHGNADSVASETPVLWADLDAKSHPNGKAGALLSLIDYEIPASVIVDSGHGYHAYWRLREPLEMARAIGIMRGIAGHLRGDHVYDAPRILRVPGTVNWKDRSQPVDVRVVRFDTTRIMRAADFVHAELAGRPKPPAPAEYRYIDPQAREELPQWLADLIQDGAPQGQRSEAAFKVMVYLAKYGWSDAEIYSVFASGGIGEKMREMRTGGERWFRRSLERARSAH